MGSIDDQNPLAPLKESLDNFFWDITLLWSLRHLNGFLY